MASEAQIAANRANASKSTGPKTEEGKAASSLNALKHGLCAERLIIDEEDPAAFEALRADYLERYRPVGLAETRLVERIAQVAWRRERGALAEAAAWRGNSRGGWILDPKSLGKQRWDEDDDPAVAARAVPVMNGVMKELLRITMYEGRLTRELVRLKAELEGLRQERRRQAEAEAYRQFAAERQAEEAAALAAAPPRQPTAAEIVAADPELTAALKDSMRGLAEWSRRERKALDAVARAALKNQAAPTP